MPATAGPHGKVEQGGVHYVVRNFLGGREPTTLAQANADVRVWCQTTAGQRFAGKTKHAREREVRRERIAWLVILAGPYYAVLEELAVAAELLEVEGEAKERLRATIKRLQAARRLGK